MLSGDLGASSELVVSADLLRGGFPVFRALSPSCPCDLVVLVGDRCCRVEVKTARLCSEGGMSCPGSSKADVVAAVNKGRVLYAVAKEGTVHIPNGQGLSILQPYSAPDSPVPTPPGQIPLQFRGTRKTAGEDLFRAAAVALGSDLKHHVSPSPAGSAIVVPKPSPRPVDVQLPVAFVNFLTHRKHESGRPV